MVNKLGYMINFFRKQQKLTMEELGEKLGKSPSAISRWISGDRSPMVEDLLRLTEIFDTDIETLLYGMDMNDKLGEHRLYHGNLSTSPVIDAEKVKLVTLSNMVFGRFAQDDLMLIQVNGSSMDKQIPRGSLVAVKEMNIESLKDGDIVCYKEEDGYKLKIIRIDADNKRYIFKPNSTNPYETDFVVKMEKSSFLEIIGKVVVVITHFI